MTTSVVAVITDVKRDGKPVCGFAFNSTGRYACGAQMRARFIPRILKAEPHALLNDAGDNFAPEKILAVMLQNEKSGGHSERSIGIGTIEVAVWDAVAKIAEQPLHRVLAERYNSGKVADKVFCYVGGGWYAPGKTTKDLQDEMSGHLDAGYTMVKMKVGGLPLNDDLSRVEAVQVDAAERRPARGRRQFASSFATTRSPMREGLPPFGLRWFEEPCDPLDFALLAEIAGAYDAPLATGENLYSTQDVENLVRFGGLARPPRRHPGRSAAGLWHRAICPHARHAGAPSMAARVCCFRMAATRCRSPSRPASASAARNPIRACSASSAASPTMRSSRTAI